MSDEHVRLVAKIQHFYEMMVNINHEIIDSAIKSGCPDKKHSCDKAQAINNLIDEYEKAFESFLYKDSNDK